MKNKKGFTLVELIVVITVTTILLGTVISIFLQSVDMFKIDETKSANQDSLNVASTSIESKIRTASAVSGTGSVCVVTTAAGDYTYSLDTSTNILTVNASYLTGRIAAFSCTVTGDVVSLSITTVNDRTGTPQSLNTTIVLRKGD